jgi:hypothetical protein
MKTRTELQFQLADELKLNTIDSHKLSALAYDLVEALATDWQTETRYLVGGLNMALRLLIERDKKYQEDN